MALLVWNRWRESRYLKKGVKEAMGKRLRFEIEKEKKDALRRKKIFEEKLKKFEK